MADRYPLFGPAGNSQSFGEMGYKSSLQVPEYLVKKGLNAFEYQCGRGVRVSEEMARSLGEKAAESGITLSLHAPYYISLSGTDESKRMASLDYILQSARAVDWLGGDRIVVHSGSASKISREEALLLAKDTLKKAQDMLDREGYGHIHMCPETMGKVNQLGTLDEVLELCTVDERLIPCVDFGHLYARTLGGIKGRDDYAAILDAIQDKLGGERAKHFHVHFSKIAYTGGGEKHHLTFADPEYGPDFAPLAELCAERGVAPFFICESAGTQAEDARSMRLLFEEAEQKYRKD
ncbi:MAG: TIM barrel protein [Oscillospiraceae bacterium]